MTALGLSGLETIRNIKIVLRYFRIPFKPKICGSRWEENGADLGVLTPAHIFPLFQQKLS
jgi:hypothetical protein